jgi:hypothetical protein
MAKRTRFWVGAVLVGTAGCGGEVGVVGTSSGGASTSTGGDASGANASGGASIAWGDGGTLSTAGSSSGATASPVDVHQLYGTEVLPCAAGYEHPNICCLGAPYKATVCTEDLTHPFGVCEPGQTAFPDPNACCVLDSKTPCLQPSGVDPTGQRANCANPCWPGGYPDATNPDIYCWFGIGISMYPKEPPCIGMCTEPFSRCSTPCPAGWSVPAGGQIDLCCQTDSDGETICFSQTSVIASPSGGGGISDANGCKFEEFVDDGNSYVMTCDFTVSNDCPCLVNGVVTKTIAGCDFGNCGFP